MKCKLLIRLIEVNMNSVPFAETPYTNVVYDLRGEDADVGVGVIGEVTLRLPGNQMDRFRANCPFTRHECSETFDIPLPEMVP